MKLSIVIPVYNTEEYIRTCLDSVIYPELDNYEILVIDDGSPDNSAKIVQEYVERHHGLIRMIRTSNGGLGAARNVGIENAKGEFLLFLDSDDTLAENAVPEIMDELSDDRDIIIYDILSVSTNNTPLDIMQGCKKQGLFSLDSYPGLIMEYPSGCNKVCRKKLFLDSGIRFPGKVWYEDLRTMPKLYLHTNKIYSMGKICYHYLMRPGSITNNATLSRHLEIIDAADDLISYYKKNGQYEKYKNQLEYTAFYNQFLTASVRVCLVAPSSPVLNQLREAFIKSFPDYKQNPYIKSMSKKHKLLTVLLFARQYSAVSFIMKLNDKLKKSN